MKFIAENLHILSKNIKKQLDNRNTEYLIDILKKLEANNPNWIDLNVGHSKGALIGILKWIVENSDNKINTPFCFDSLNIYEIENALKILKNPQNCMLNSTNYEKKRLNDFTNLMKTYNTNLVALLNDDKSGVLKSASDRLDIAFKYMDYFNKNGIKISKIYFDPLILPISVDQEHFLETFYTIKMLKESFQEDINIVIGLSNISNGSPKELRPLINHVCFTIAKAAGLSSIICDIFDEELLRISKMLEYKIPQTKYDETLINIYNQCENLEDIDNLVYNKSQIDETSKIIIKTARILLNKEVYSHNYLSVI